MPKISYSAEAIQARQQAAYNEWQAKYAQPKPTEQAQPTAGQPQVNSTFTLPGGQMPTNYTPPQFSAPNAQPYMAQDMANVQTLFGDEAAEPIYYSGRVRDGLAGTWDAMIANPFKNWARRTWAAINNPNDILPAPTAVQKAKIEQKAKESKAATEATKTYDINRFVMEDVFGISMEEAYQAEAMKQVAKEEGMATDVGEATRSVKAAAGTALTSLLGSFEWASRNVSAVAKGIDETLDEVAGPDRNTLQPLRDVADRMIVEAQKKNGPIYVPPGIKPPKQDVIESPNVMAEKVKNMIEFSKTSDSINPVELFKDGVRLAMNLDKVKFDRLTYNVNKNLAGSTAIYSLLADDAKNAEYERRYAAGENPAKLAYELQNPGTELLGGILYDPTTWISGGAAKTAIDPKTGQRILRGGIQSAAGNAIEQALPQKRMAQPVKDLVDDLVKASSGGKPITNDELLGKLKNVFDTAKKEFDKWANERSLTSYTAEAKNKIVAEESADLFRQMLSREELRNHPDAMDIVAGTIANAIDFAKTGNPKSASALVNSQFFGQLPMSPQGIRTWNLLASLDEISPAIETAVREGDVRKLADVYASQIEKAAKKQIISVPEMAEAANKIAEIENKIKITKDAKELSKLGDELAKAQELKKMYDGLPSHIKFINGANEVAKKPYLASMGMFSQLYFGLNRFAYPTRNVVAAIPGMAYEFGIKTALEAATKAITGSQIETVGQAMLQTMEKEVQDLIGYVPEVFKFGPSPIGEFVKGNKKILGVMRGGGEVAQLSEQLMSAQIILKTIRREVKNALKNGAIPSVGELVNAGLPLDVANRLSKYAYEYGGDANKAVQAFRKTLSEGGEEVWRHLPLPDKMADFLNTLEPGGRLVKEFDTIRETAQSADEFRKLSDELWQKVDAMAETARTVRTNLEEVPELTEYTDDIQKATESVYGKQFKYGTPEEIDNFERVLQGFQNAKSAMRNVTETMKSWMYRNGLTDDFTADFMRLNGDNYPTQRAARTAINKVNDNWKNMSSKEIYDTLNQMDKGAFRISDMTDVDPNKVSNKEMLRIAWDAYFKWSNNFWADASTAYNKGSIDILQQMASKLNLTVEQVAKMSGANYENAIQEYNTAKKLFDESQIDSIVAARRKVKDGTTLANVDIATIKQMGYNGLDHVRNSINKYRKAMGMDDYATINDVPFWEVEDLFRRKKRTEGFIPDVAKVTNPKSNVIKPIANRPENMSADDLLKFREDYYAPNGPEYVEFYHGSGNVGEILRSNKLMSGAGGFDKLQGIDRGGKVFLSPDLSYSKQYAGYGASAGIKHADPGVVVVRVKRKTGTLNNIELILSPEDLAKGDYEIVGRLEDATKAEAPSPLLDPANYTKMSQPPIAPDQAVTPARMVAASPDAKGMFDAFVDATAKQWGVIEPVPGALTDKAEEALGKWAKNLTSNMGTVKNEAGDIAKATRNAMLYDYRKKLWNVAAQYISPFHYYHASASNQWLQNVAADPKWGAAYLDYKEYMERKHAGLPDFWKQNVAVSGLPGYDRENPLFFNIEASVNPLYQMIGQDFNDPKRRADWFSTVVDDASKLIPGIYQPLQWLVAANLYRKGEAEAGERWLGRLIPQTKLIKSVTNKLGVDIPLTKYNELDPFVGLLNDGLDPYEEGRVMRFLAGMPGVTEEAKIQAAHSREGDLWDQAVKGALGARAGAEFASYTLGVGYKPRTSADIDTDKFYEDYRKLIAARSIMSPDDYRDAWDALRIKHPFMDTLLIGRKAGEDRDTAFAYNVLGRVPPSEMSDISKFIGIEPYMLESFYDNKGDLSKMLPQDKDRFMAAMVDLSAMLKMPDGATKAEWSQAKKMYQELNKALVEDYGENIIQKMDEFYDVPEADRTDWLEQNPQVKDAMSDKTAYIANTPILSAYYGGIDNVSRYYNNIMYEKLEKEFGSDIQQKVDYYYDLGDQGLTKEQAAFKKQMGLKAYFDRVAELQQQANLAAIDAAKFIPEGKDYQIRPEFSPQSGIQQGAMQYATTDSQSQMAGAIYSQLSEPMKVLLQQYYEGGDLPYAVGKRLEYLGRDYGLSKQEVLRLLGVEQ